MAATDRQAREDARRLASFLRRLADCLDRDEAHLHDSAVGLDADGPSYGHPLVRLEVRWWGRVPEYVARDAGASGMAEVRGTLGPDGWMRAEGDAT